MSQLQLQQSHFRSVVHQMHLASHSMSYVPLQGVTLGRHW